MTRVLGGSVVMRMLLPPLLTVVVDRSSAPAIHDSDSHMGLFRKKHEGMPAACQATCNATPGLVDMRVSYTIVFTACGRVATAVYLAALLRPRWMKAKMV